MTFTGYFKTEKTASKFGGGWTEIDTSIDETVHENVYCPATAIGGYKQKYVDALGTTVFCQNENDPDTSYKVLDETTWDGAEVEYSGTNTATPIYSAITGLTGGVGTIFGSNQDFDDHQADWLISFQGKASDIPSGEVASLEFKFYKVATNDTETLLFSVKKGIGTLYSLSPITTLVRATGSVTTSDRLLIKVYFDSAAPA